MTTLTDRYVWGVLRAVPETQRPDLEPEIRALIADALEARSAVDAGEVPAAAERAVLAELGDPEVLAARYTDRSLFLIGPALLPRSGSGCCSRSCRSSCRSPRSASWWRSR